MKCRDTVAIPPTLAGTIPPRKTTERPQSAAQALADRGKIPSIKKAPITPAAIAKPMSKGQA